LGPVVSVIRHDINEVDDAEQGPDGGVEAEDDEEPLVGPADAVAQEITKNHCKIVIDIHLYLCLITWQHCFA
jgi:hypothetical protein